LIWPAGLFCPGAVPGTNLRLATLTSDQIFFSTSLSPQAAKLLNWIHFIDIPAMEFIRFAAEKDYTLGLWFSP
jgi:hypothetical protein